MDLKQATQTTTGRARAVSGPRALGIFVSSAAAYGIGYYAAIAILFSILGLNNASDAPWEVATIGTGSILGGLVGTLTSPRRGWAPLVAAVLVGGAALLLGLFIDIGFEYGIGTGLVAALAAALVAYAGGADGKNH